MLRNAALFLLLTCWLVAVARVQAAREAVVLRALGEIAASTQDQKSPTAQDLLEGPPELTTTLPLFHQLVREDRRELLRQVGELHLLGSDTLPHNATHATLFLLASATYGDGHAQFLLGALKASPDVAGAQLYYEFAARARSIEASMALGYRALHGYGVSKSCSAAMRHYKFAADRVVAEQDGQKLQLYAFPEPVRLSDNEGARYRSDLNPAEDLQRAEYLRQRAADLDNAHLLVQSASITLFSDLYMDLHGASDHEESAVRQREARRFLERAIELGSVTAQALLGHVYAYGLADCTANASHAVGLYEAALTASQGSPNGEAANGLGMLYTRGIGDIPVDLDRARKLFELAASAGHAEGVYNAGIALLELGLSHSTRAKEYFVAAAHVGHLKSLFQLARLKQRQVPHYYDIGGGSSGVTCEEVVVLYKRVAEYSRDGTALMTQALAHTQHGNWALALELYSIAAEMGYEVAQSNAAWLIQRMQRQFLGSFDSANKKMTEHQYTRLVTRAAEQDSADALVRLGDAAFLDEDYTVAMQRYQHADLVSAGTCARALYSVGYMYEHGLGVLAVSTERAALYYHLAGEKEPALHATMTLLQLKLRVQDRISQALELMQSLWLAMTKCSDEEATAIEHEASEDVEMTAFHPSRDVVELTNHRESIDLEGSSRGVDLVSSSSAPVEFAPVLQFLGAQSRLHLELTRGELPLECQDFTIETWLFIDDLEAQSDQGITLVDALDNFQLKLLPTSVGNVDSTWMLRFHKFSLVSEQLPELVISFPNAPLAPQTWNHIALTFDATYQTVMLLLNAQVKQVRTFRPHPAELNRDYKAAEDAEISSSSRLLAIGGSLARIHSEESRGSGGFSGQLVHFRLWKTRKSAAEIRVLMMEQYQHSDGDLSPAMARDLVVHLRYRLHGLSMSSGATANTEEGEAESSIMNGDHAVPNARGVQLKIVVFPPPHDK